MAGRRDRLQEDARLRVRRLLQENAEMSQRELADAFGISVGGVHYVLSALIQQGLLKLGNFTAAKDKRRYAYILTPKGIAAKAAIPRWVLRRKIDEYEALRAEIDALRDEIGEERAPGGHGMARR